MATGSHLVFRGESVKTKMADLFFLNLTYFASYITHQIYLFRDITDIHVCLD